MKQYHELLRSILENGTEHEDRTGVGTISHFGYQTRFDLREGFPIVTTKKVPFRWVAEELFWFLSGSTDEADLRARGGNFFGGNFGRSRRVASSKIRNTARLYLSGRKRLARMKILASPGVRVSGCHIWGQNRGHGRLVGDP